MGAKSSKYSHKLKIALVEKVLGGIPVKEVARKEGISANLITRWKKEYKQGKFCNSFNPEQEIRKLEAIVSRLEKNVEKLARDKYTLK